jgi:pimeloyl-ACP methyl ester carboxylesterase
MTDAKADLRTIELDHGTIAYRDIGSGEPIVFVHGALVDGTLWRKVTPLLEGRFRCLVPNLPLGSHRIPMHPAADLSPPGLARLLADFLAALDLEGVTLVGNDTGGAICQLVAAHHPERLGRLVLTPCDAFEDFLPLAFRYLQVAARIPGGTTALTQSMRLGFVRRAPFAYGWLSKRPVPADVLDAWVAPIVNDPGVRRDARKLLRGISKRYTLEAAERLRDFEKPTLIAWAPEDRFFKLRNGERLANAIPDARLVRIEDSLTFVSEDQPQRLAATIAEFVDETSGMTAPVAVDQHRG